jgi:hypothetical protein
VRLSKFRSRPDPGRADDEKNLRQNEITQSQRFFEGDTLLFNIAFCAIELDCHRRLLSG